MKKPFKKLSSTFLLVCAASFFHPSYSHADDFATWLTELRLEASTKGITDATLNSAFAGLQPIPEVLELDRKQPEFTQSFWRYLNLLVSDTRIERGKKLLTEHKDLLVEIEKKYGVQPRFLVAFWGLETNFGDHLGSFPVIGSLATLAFDERRSVFFRKELMAALTILDEGHITVQDMRGSWAGAMGQPQFMPSTFTQFAVDYNGDGRRDIWHCLPDVFASASNFLKKSGWRSDQTWGQEVSMPKDFDPDHAGLDQELPLSQWQTMGIRNMDGSALPMTETKASLLLPAGYTGPAFLVYENFRTILRWNRSNLYAVAVGHLADRLIGKEPFKTLQPLIEVPLRRADVVKIQELLAARGFYNSKADGIAGSGTYKAIKEFQRSISLPADGFPSAELLDRLNRAEQVGKSPRKE